MQQKTELEEYKKLIENGADSHYVLQSAACNGHFEVCARSVEVGGAL